VTSLASGCPDLRAVDLCGCVLITGIWSDSLAT
jgi:F-box and leucine-rich repeat protein 1 (S-phase kinase-associated protein 2)